MKKVKILGDTINKVADTSTVFYFVLLNGGQEQGVTGKTVSFTIANNSGYLFDVPAVIDGNVISLDFSNEQLKQLTPDTYHMEVYVTNGDGDVEVYPSQGAIDFRVGKNLHGTQGKLVPQITFDTVLHSVDEKIAEYTKTFANDANVVHNTGNETVAGDKTLTGKLSVNNLNVSGDTPNTALTYNSGFSGGKSYYYVRNKVVNLFIVNAKGFTASGQRAFEIPSNIQTTVPGNTYFPSMYGTNNALVGFNGTQVYISTSSVAYSADAPLNAHLTWQLP